MTPGISQECVRTTRATFVLMDAVNDPMPPSAAELDEEDDITDIVIYIPAQAGSLRSAISKAARDVPRWGSGGLRDAPGGPQVGTAMRG